MSEPLFAGSLAGRGLTEAAAGDLLRNRDWEAATPGLTCGITTAPTGTFSVSASSGDGLIEAYSGLAARLGFDFVAVPRQVHGSDVEIVGRPDPGVGDGPPRVLLAGRIDGLVTGEPGVLLASTAADCVPVFLLEPEARLCGLVHAGWRGTVAGILGRGVERLRELGGRLDRMRVHLGPAICGACYEVDEPVLRRFDSESARAHLDLRGALVEQAVRAGLTGERVTASTFCTSCGEADLHSHRASAGEAGRMAAFTGFGATDA